MTAIELGSLILAVEFGFIAWGILFLLLRYNRNQRNADQGHAGAVMEELQEQEVDRREALSNLFATTYKLEGNELNSKVDEYVEREKAFYSAMLSLYLERDGTKLRDIPAELTKVLTPWAHITPSGMVDASEVGSLQDEKTALALELNNTKQTLEHLMDEYTAAFDKNEASKPKAPKPEPIPQPEPEEDEAFEETFEEVSEKPRTQTLPEEKEEDEQLDALEEPEDLDAAALSALGIEPDSSATDEKTTPPAPDAPAIEEEEEDVFELPAAPVEEQPADDDEQADKPPTDNDLADELAREELEGLADLFGGPSDKK